MRLGGRKGVCTSWFQLDMEREGERSNIGGGGVVLMENTRRRQNGICQKESSKGSSATFNVSSM